MEKINWSKIEIKLIGLDQETTERYRQIIEKLFLSHAFDYPSVRIFMDFDDKRNLMQITKAEERLWKRQRVLTKT